ncbi:MAG: hypothetical protein ACQEQV_08370 [Fibrobacterota bacterium]
MDNSFWENLKKGLEDGVSVSKEAVNHYSKLGKLKVERHQIEKRIDATLRDLGQRAYDMKKDGQKAKIGDDIAIESFVKDIDTSHKALDALDEEIQALKDAYSSCRDNSADGEKNAAE